MASEKNPKLILVTESLTKTGNDERNIFPVLQNYSVFSNDVGRGVKAFVHSSLNVFRRTDLETFNPSIVLEIVGSISKTLVILAYRSPHASPEENDSLNQMITDIVDTVKKDNTCLLVGDFNYPSIDWESETCSNLPEHPAYKFLDTIQDCFLIQSVKEPTHFRGLQQANILDLVLSVGVDDELDISYLPPLGKSHHCILSFSFPFVQSVPTLGDKKSFLMNKGNYQGMRDSLRELDWSALLNEMSVEEAWTFIENKLHDMKESFIPCRRIENLTTKPNNIVSQSVLDKIRAKRKAFKMYKKYKTQANYKAYTKARNQVKWALKHSVKDKELHLVSNIKSNPKAFYSYVSSRSKPKEGVSNLTKSDGSLTNTDREKAEILNSFFSSVFTKEDTTNVPSFPLRTDATLTDIVISEETIRKELNKLNVSKSCGPDGIHPRLLRELSNELALPLKILFEKTMAEGKLPHGWKRAEVKPIFKKGEKTKPGNYRPVSLTSIICKVFESIVRDALNNHLAEHDLLSKNQYGFTAGRSCVTQLLSTLYDCMKHLDGGDPVDAVYLDLQKAFDKVPHARLLVKLKGYGINGKVLSWIENFLSDRSQFVTVGAESSVDVPVTSGVPQGSVLGPTLFVYFINDMPDILDCMVKIFADDTKLYSPVHTADLRTKLQKNIDELLAWTDQWQILFNADKCKVIHFGKDNPCHEYTMNGNVLESTDVEKDLGVHVDKNLSFEHHMTETVKKANRVLGMISRFIEHKDSSIMIPLFKALVRPILEYGNTVWCPFLRKHCDLIEKVQRRFTKRIIGMNDMEYEDRLKALKLPSMEFRRLRGDMIETFKILRGFYDTNTTKTLYELNDLPTRGHDFKLSKRPFSLTIFEHFFSNRIVNNWNSLPHPIVLSGTINSFKRALDEHWAEKMYCTNFKKKS